MEPLLSIPQSGVCPVAWMGWGAGRWGSARHGTRPFPH